MIIGGGRWLEQEQIFFNILVYQLPASTLINQMEEQIKTF